MFKTPLHNPLYYVYNLYFTRNLDLQQQALKYHGIAKIYLCHLSTLPFHICIIVSGNLYFLTPHLQNRNGATPLPRKCIIMVNLSIFIIYIDAKQLFPKIFLPTFNLYPTSKSTTNLSHHLFKSYPQMPCSTT